MNKKISELSGLEKKIVAKEISVSLMEAREHMGVTYWCSPDGLCEVQMDYGTVCGSEDLVIDMIDADTEGF